MPKKSIVFFFASVFFWPSLFWASKVIQEPSHGAPRLCACPGHPGPAASTRLAVPEPARKQLEERSCWNMPLTFLISNDWNYQLNGRNWMVQFQKKHVRKIGTCWILLSWEWCCLTVFGFCDYPLSFADGWWMWHEFVDKSQIDVDQAKLCFFNLRPIILLCHEYHEMESSSKYEMNSLLGVSHKDHLRNDALLGDHPQQIVIVPIIKLKTDEVGQDPK